MYIYLYVYIYIYIYTIIKCINLQINYPGEVPHHSIGNSCCETFRATNTQFTGPIQNCNVGDLICTGEGEVWAASRNKEMQIKKTLFGVSVTVFRHTQATTIRTVQFGCAASAVDTERALGYLVQTGP